MEEDGRKLWGLSQREPRTVHFGGFSFIITRQSNGISPEASQRHFSAADVEEQETKVPRARSFCFFTSRTYFDVLLYGSARTFVFYPKKKREAKQTVGWLSASCGASI